MKVKLDENLPARLQPVLERLGHEVHTVHQENLTGRPDNDIWQAACAEGRFLITQDLDFSDSRQFTPGTHSGILLVRLREPGAQADCGHRRGRT
jgi:predicted nuclease of predicted toxin-antitoxin system